MAQPMDVKHTPTKRGRKMVCRGATKEIRARFLRWYDNARILAKEALRRIKQGVFSVLPPGFFYPGGFLLSNVLPQASPLAFG